MSHPRNMIDDALRAVRDRIRIELDVAGHDTADHGTQRRLCDIDRELFKRLPRLATNKV